ncbi:hypothetical protein H7972_18090 [Pseudomonas aeruginosa]|nr:hypothetical protein [Pseudomonas aeruginosa]
MTADQQRTDLLRGLAVDFREHPHLAGYQRRQRQPAALRACSAAIWSLR